MLSQGQVGPIASTGIGTQVALRSGQLGDQIMSELHGRYYEGAYRQNRFIVANQAAQAVSIALATTYTGLVLSNPLGSAVNLVLEKVGLTLSAAPAAIAPLGLLLGYNGSADIAHTTPSTTLRNSFMGGAAPVGKVDTAATLSGTLTVGPMLMSGFTAAALPSASPALIDMEGSIILPPGGYVGIYALTAVTGLFSLQWEEVPR
jgi:hypothetical protein